MGRRIEITSQSDFWHRSPTHLHRISSPGVTDFWIDSNSFLVNTHVHCNSLISANLVHLHPFLSQLPGVERLERLRRDGKCDSFIRLTFSQIRQSFEWVIQSIIQPPTHPTRDLRITTFDVTTQLTASNRGDVFFPGLLFLLLSGRRESLKERFSVRFVPWLVSMFVCFFLSLFVCLKVHVLVIYTEFLTPFVCLA